MSDMPERIWATPFFEGHPAYGYEGEWHIDPDAAGGTPYRRADAPPTLAEAMRCPEVTSLVKAARLAEEQIKEYGGDGFASGLIAALRPFTEGTDK